MIILNGKKFARTEKEFINSLFETDGTCVGFYRPNKSSITLMNHRKEKVGVINKHKVLCCATLLDNGKYFYSYADIDLLGSYDFVICKEEVSKVYNELIGA